MGDNKRTVLCLGDNCPIREGCAYYCPTMDTFKTKHWGLTPYDHEKQLCKQFVPKETDAFHHDDIISDYEE
jgi:hypothetical protein